MVRQAVIPRPVGRAGFAAGKFQAGQNRLFLLIIGGVFHGGESMGSSNNRHSNCLFCRWIRAGVAVETLGTVAAFSDGYPVTQGHLLIAPLRHTPDWLSMTSQEIGDSETLVRALVDRIRQRDPLVSGFNLGTNIGASAGQTVLHAHIHLIPRRDGDTANPEGGIRGVIDGKRGYHPA
jgi:diadenosine tetraphosphate (Ap4A) HIT family hydrolase